METQLSLPYYHSNSLEYRHIKYRINLFNHGMKYYVDKARIWKANNKDKVKKNSYKYTHKPGMIEYRQKFYQENRERIRARKRELYRKNINKNRAQSHVYYLKNKSKIQEKTKKYYNDWKYYNKFQTLFHYTDGKMWCNGCNESIFELLTIDHINGGGGKHRKEIGSRNIYVWLRKNDYPKGFQVLCYNCNMVKHKVTKERYNEIIDELQNRKLKKRMI